MNTEDKLIVLAYDMKAHINSRVLGTDLTDKELKQYCDIRRQLKQLANAVSIRKQNDNSDYDASFVQSFGIGRINQPDLSGIKEAIVKNFDDEPYCDHCGSTDLSYDGLYATGEVWTCNICHKTVYT